MAKIEAIRYLGKAPVFNMEVESFHNYITAGGTVLHNCDGIRYFCVSRVLQAEPEKEVLDQDIEEDAGTDYDEYMCGGDITPGYM